MWAGESPDRQAVIAEIESIEANPPGCFPDPGCHCPTCNRYCEFHDIVDALAEDTDPYARV